MRRTIAERHARHSSIDIERPSQGHIFHTNIGACRRYAVWWEPFYVERLDD